MPHRALLAILIEIHLIYIFVVRIIGDVGTEPGPDVACFQTLWSFVIVSTLRLLPKPASIDSYVSDSEGDVGIERVWWVRREVFEPEPDLLLRVGGKRCAVAGVGGDAGAQDVDLETWVVFRVPDGGS